MMNSFRFSAGDIPMRERAGAIRGLRERGILPFEALPGQSVGLRISKRFLPGVGILSGLLCGLRQDSGGHAADATDDLFFGVNLVGSSSVVQGGREIVLRSGEAVCLNCERGPFRMLRPTPVRFLGLRVPRKSVGLQVQALDDATMRVIPAATEATRLLVAYVQAIGEMELSGEADMSRLLVNHLHDLIALSIGATRDAAAAAQDTSLPSARLRAMKSDIDANLEDETLSVVVIAARHGVTPRYVHKLFERDGTTYTHFVLQRRLERAYRMLRDIRFAKASVSSIAYGVGFSDISYFNRAFRSRFGATPSDIRNISRA